MKRKLIVLLFGLLVLAGSLGMLKLSFSRTARFERALKIRAEQAGAPAAVLQFPELNELPGAGPFRQAVWFRLVWKERRLGAWERRDTDRGAVVFAGDSIIQGWLGLAGAFPDCKVANRGIAGDTTRGLLFRFREDVLQLNPRAVVLLCGINDLLEGAPADLVAQNLQAVVQLCRAADPNFPVVICTVLPVNGTNTVVNQEVRALNSQLAAFIKGNPGLTLADSWSALADPNGAARWQDVPDYLHPNDAGYAKLAAALRPALEQVALESRR